MLLGTGNAGGSLAPQGIRTFLGTGLAPTISQVIAAANFYTLNDTSPTYTSTTSRWDPYNNVIKYANQRRQRPFVINGVTFQSDLIESARTNLLASGTSEHFERWTVGSGTPVVTTDTIACPNAEVVADTLTEGVGTGTQGVSQLITKAASSLAYVGSCYIKNKTGSREVSINLDDGTLINGVQVRINPATGALTSAPAAFGTGWAVNTAAGTGGYTITDAGGGWYRVSVIATSDTTTTVRFRVGLYNGSDSYAGDGTSAVYLWGADANQATFAAATCLCRNLLLQSETLGTTWAVTRTTITGNSTADPITGNLTADTINEDSTASSTHLIKQSFTKAASSIQFTLSTYIKQSGRTWCLVQCGDSGFSNGIGSYFDVANGVKGTTATTGTGWTLNSSHITAVGAWYRIDITVTSNSTTTIETQILTASGDNGKTYTGTGIAALICWGNQLEYGPTATQYWATTTAGLRTADVLTSSLTGITDARTNRLTWSEQFDNAAWTKTDITVTANTGTDPNSNSYCDLLTEGVAGTADTASASATISANSAVAASCYIKASSVNSWVRIRVSSDAGANGWRAWFNLATGAVGTAVAFGTGTATSLAIEIAPNGWYRCKTVGKVDAAATSCVMSVCSASADASATRVASSVYYAFGAQVEQASAVGDYIPVGGTAITTGPTGLSRTTGTLVSIVMPRNWTVDQDGATFWRPCDGVTSATNATIRRQNATAVSVGRADSGGNRATSFTDGLVSNTLVQQTMTWSPSAVTGYLNGALGGTNSPVQSPYNAETGLQIGSAAAGASAFFGYVLCLYSHQQVIPGSDLALIYAATTAP